MTIEQFASLVGAITGMGSIFAVFYLGGVKLAKMEVKIDTLWEFIMRRGVSEGVQKGFMTINSPLMIDEDLREKMSEALPALREFYRKLGRRITDSDLACEIEKRFGQEILKKMCIPYGMSAGSCLIIAMAVAKNNTSGISLADLENNDKAA